MAIRNDDRDSFCVVSVPDEPDCKSVIRGRIKAAGKKLLVFCVGSKGPLQPSPLFSCPDRCVLLVIFGESFGRQRFALDVMHDVEVIRPHSYPRCYADYRPCDSPFRQLPPSSPDASSIDAEQCYVGREHIGHIISRRSVFQCVTDCCAMVVGKSANSAIVLGPLFARRWCMKLIWDNTRSFKYSVDMRALDSSNESLFPPLTSSDLRDRRCVLRQDKVLFVVADAVAAEAQKVIHLLKRSKAHTLSYWTTELPGLLSEGRQVRLVLGCEPRDAQTLAGHLLDTLPNAKAFLLPPNRDDLHFDEVPRCELTSRPVRLSPAAPPTHQERPNDIPNSHRRPQEPALFPKMPAAAPTRAAEQTSNNQAVLAADKGGEKGCDAPEAPAAVAAAEEAVLPAERKDKERAADHQPPTARPANHPDAPKASFTHSPITPAAASAPPIAPQHHHRPSGPGLSSARSRESEHPSEAKSSNGAYFGGFFGDSPDDEKDREDNDDEYWARARQAPKSDASVSEEGQEGDGDEQMGSGEADDGRVAWDAMTVDDLHFILSIHPCPEVNKVADALTTGMQTSKEGSSSSASSGSLLSSSDCSGYTPQHLLDDLAGPLPLALHLRPAADMRHALLPVMRVGPMIAIYLTLRQVRRLAETRGGVSRGDIAEALESSREGDDCHNPLAAEDVLAVGELYDMLKTGQGLRPLANRLKQERFTGTST
ncbi:unnamed protein product [Vitrella brassicaformis CCMP3155]|uniref:Uncharacterized protein n=2 Tax=Vitrella brassicaformis TaxID=1169539 RepID=A0A0G4F872_VITBC|nr:unnamed protein product [Vitrella brassicaformis CCMP3155]|eukprot:CEM08919.1 unnamed protein product [Vitrella brassicaformis CCMP3155]